MKLYNGDCIDIMKKLIYEGVKVDAIITDPPYGIDFKSSRQKHQKKIVNDSLDDWLKILPEFLNLFKEIITENGCCCCCCCGGGKTPVTALFTIEAIKHFNLIQTLVWRKIIGLGWKYRPSYENIVILSKSKNNYNFFDTSKKCSNVIDGINQKIPRKGEHPTEKPIKLMEKLIETHTKEGMTILDPFMGSGTTGVACSNLNRNFIGIELDEGYFDIAKKRIEESQLKLF